MLPNQSTPKISKSVTSASVVTCAVVQGNIRRGTTDVLGSLSQCVDHVILSTWDDEPDNIIPKGNWQVVLSRKPSVTGYSHRNFQRLSTAAGLRTARELGATHVLKWRTDMLATQLDIAKLLAWSQADVLTGMRSRLVTCAFRNLTVRQDWFSSIPDLFAFSDIDLMQMLWGDEDFDYGLQMNVPASMAKECGSEWTLRKDAAGLYCAEAELYAIFKSRLQSYLVGTLHHIDIAKKYMRLIDHRRLGICWFGEQGFRSIPQALQHPWWTESLWLRGEPIVSEWAYPEAGLIKKLKAKYQTPRIIRREQELQDGWYKAYKCRK